MACTGPDPREEEADKVTIEVLKMLQNKYDLSSHPFYLFKDEMEVAKQKLKEAIREIFKFDAYEGF